MNIISGSESAMSLVQRVPDYNESMQWLAQAYSCEHVRQRGYADVFDGMWDRPQIEIPFKRRLDAIAPRDLVPGNVVCVICEETNQDLAAHFRGVSAGRYGYMLYVDEVRRFDPEWHVGPVMVCFRFNQELIGKHVKTSEDINFFNPFEAFDKNDRGFLDLPLVVGRHAEFYAGEDKTRKSTTTNILGLVVLENPLGGRVDTVPASYVPDDTRRFSGKVERLLLPRP